MYTGPAFNLFLRITNFSIGPFKVSKYTAPGVSTPVHCVMEEGGERRGRREEGGREEGGGRREGGEREEGGLMYYLGR